MPYEYRTCAFYYNEKILDEIGAAVPTTYDEVVEVAGKAAAAGYTGFGTGFSDTDNSAIISHVLRLLHEPGGQDIWNEDGEADFATKRPKSSATSWPICGTRAPADQRGLGQLLAP